MTALAVKSTVALLVALFVVLAARRTRASARHMVLAALFAFLLLLPFADRFVPATVSIPEEQVSQLLSSRAESRDLAGLGGTSPFPPTRAPGPSTDARDDIFINLYFAGVALFLAWLAVGVYRLRRLAANSEVWLEGTARMNEIAHETNIRRPALVVVSDETNVPLTFGFRMSTIVFPTAAREWDAAALGRALRHELEHVRRDDWALQLLARAACALYWPNPLVWAAWRRFCFEAERACDDAVVTTFAAPEEYAGQLVALARNARRMTGVPALGMASRSKLAGRVSALLDRRQRRGPHGRVATAFAVAITLLFLVTVAPAKLVAAAKDVDHEFNSSALAEDFLEAARDGEIGGVQRFLEVGVDVNLVLHGDGTALIAAARAGQMEMVRFLVENRADVNLGSPGDGNPLIAAARRGHADIVEFLLDRGARIDEMVQGDENALIKAAWNGQEDVVALLIRRGANVNARYVEQGDVRTPLSMARRGKHARIEGMLLSAGARE